MNYPAIINPPALLPCPFCDCSPLYENVEERSERRYVSLTVGCGNCNAEQRASIPYNRFSKMNPHEIVRELVSAVAAKWNQRPSFDPVDSRESALDALDEANVKEDGWVEDWLANIKDPYARGYLHSKVSQLNGVIGYLSEEFRAELRLVCTGNIWSK